MMRNFNSAAMITSINLPDLQVKEPLFLRCSFVTVTNETDDEYLRALTRDYVRKFVMKSMAPTLTENLAKQNITPSY